MGLFFSSTARYQFIFILWIISFLAISCNTGNNINWKQLYDHYSAAEDSIQREAVKFLQENINGHYSAVISLVDPLTKQTVYVTGEEKTSLTSLELADMLNNGWEKKFEFIADNSVLSTERIIDEIDRSYTAWTTSEWFKDTPKWIYLNYLLPYRVDAEYPDYWRKELDSVLKEEKVKWKRDTKSNYYQHREKKFISDYIRKVIRKRQSDFYTYDEQIGTLSKFPSFTELKIFKRGECFTGSSVATYFMRAGGIPTTIDIIPYWGSINGSHGLDVHWDPVDKMMVKEHPFDLPVAKVFRKTFKYEGLWTNDISKIVSDNDFKIPFLKSDYIKDVTGEHVLSRNLEYELPSSIDVPLAYICINSYGEWKPIFWSKVENSIAKFTDMGTNILYRIAVPTKTGDVSFVSPMFYLNQNGELIFPKLDNSKSISLKIKRINHGTEAYVKRGRRYSLFVVDESGNEKLIESSVCKLDSNLIFNRVPDATYYILKQDGARRNLSRYFSIRGGNQDWLMEIDTALYKQHTGYRK
ncbi:hypothetical protein RYH73_19430 [Olivibacter sp. CPCC 100613]|uniref:hypothetical protein n=1 Tax=Olivibacter sp. CPCC 100613 TaxID=3079931 RepID=UPI002FF48A5A